MNYESCTLCPRNCRVNRHITTGYCGCGTSIKAARAALHQWEEPCISGVNGSGTVFFTGCTLRCCYCQNHAISQGGTGRELTSKELAQIFLRLQDEGAHNINLVTATQYLPEILRSLDLAKPRLTVPIVYNSSGYENLDTVRSLDGYVDIWLPDLKYESCELSKTYSGAPDYFEKASAAIRQMISQSGPPQMEPYVPQLRAGTGSTPDLSQPCDTAGITLMKKGTIIRHMVLPGARKDSIRLLHWMKDTLPEHQYYISLMSQYTPFYKSGDHPEINRRITSYEYNQVVDTAIELGLTEGYMQEKSSAKEEYTPPFDLEGL